MAIQLSTEDRQGFTSDYWRLTSYTVEIATSKVYGHFQVYKSKADFDGGKTGGEAVTQEADVNLGSDTARNIYDNLQAAAIAPLGALEGGTIVA